jgi:hypothetical protein
VKSTYPAKEQAGQVFPLGAVREAPGDLAKPVIVVGAEVVRGCDQFHAKNVLPQVKNPAKARPRT